MTSPLVTHGVGKRFRRRWALRDCTLTIPERAIVGLAGPNGAGKSTLLGLTVGLFAPTEGRIDVLGRDPRRQQEVLADVGYVARDAPLYRTFTVRDTIEFARATNPGWDESIASEFLTRLSADDRVSTLSAGERARLALAVALGKRPALLLLDEPFARLDPLAAREFLQLLMDGVSELEATVVIASHVVADIERVSDHIVLLSEGHVRLEGSVEELLSSHRLLTGRGAAARQDPRRPGDRPRAPQRAPDDAARTAQRPRRRPFVVGRRDRARGPPARLHGARAPARPDGAGEGAAAMAWVTWRQHRHQLLIGLALIVGLALAALVTGLPMRTAYQREALSSCLPPTARSGCDIIVRHFQSEFGSRVDIARYLILLPALVGMFVGAPLLARELEHGTHRFAWTQSVTRRRWLLSKTLLLALAVTLSALVLSAIVTWWRQPFDGLEGRMSPSGFEIQGLVVPAYAVFALALGVLAGAALRRSLAAISLTLVAFVAVRLAVANAPAAALRRARARNDGGAGSRRPCA